MGSYSILCIPFFRESLTNRDKRESIIEARNSVDRLFTLVENHYQEMSFRLQNLERDETEQPEDKSVLVDDAISITTVAAEGSNTRESDSRVSGTRTFSFTEDLQKSWVYKRNHAFRESIGSLSTRSIFTSHWSCLSALSMTDVSTISVINLPITESEVFNVHRSSQTWSNERSDPGWPLQTLDNSKRFSGTAVDTRDHVPDGTIRPCKGCGDTTKDRAFELGRHYQSGFMYRIH